MIYCEICEKKSDVITLNKELKMGKPVYNSKSGGLKIGRWTGRIIQPQSFKRPEFKEKEIEKAIDLLKRKENSKDQKA